jgi:hypothetical protein
MFIMAPFHGLVTDLSWTMTIQTIQADSQLITCSVLEPCTTPSFECKGLSCFVWAHVHIFNNYDASKFITRAVWSKNKDNEDEFEWGLGFLPTGNFSYQHRRRLNVYSETKIIFQPVKGFFGYGSLETRFTLTTFILYIYEKKIIIEFDLTSIIAQIWLFGHDCQAGNLAQRLRITSDIYKYENTK